MKKEVKYPIKYTLMPLRVDKTIKEDLKYYYIAGHIVSKAYIKEEKIIHNPDGTSKKEYKVIYPYQIRIEDFENKDQEPIIDFIDEPVEMTSFELFDNYEAARCVRERKNIDYPDIVDYLEVEDQLLEKTSEILTIEEQRAKEISILERLMGNREKTKIKKAQ